MKNETAALLILWMFFCFQPLFALDPEIENSQYIHEAWGLKEGLPQVTVKHIAQTRDGYLWLATKEGLARFDGVTFTVYDKSTTPTLNNHNLTVLHEDRKGLLWIGTYGGVTCLKGGVFINDSSGYGLSESVISAFCEDKDGGLRIGTLGDGLFYLKKKGTFYTRAEGLTSNQVTSLCCDSTGDLWVGTSNGLNRFRNGHFAADAMANGPGGNITPGNIINVIYRDSKERLWIGAKNGLTCRDKEKIHTFDQSHGLKDNNVRAILEDRDHNLWFGTTKGLHRLKGGDPSQFGENLTSILEDNLVESLLEDREGSLWIGTGADGLHRLRTGMFTTYARTEGLAHNYTRSIVPGSDNSLWIATARGLNHLKKTGTSAGRHETETFLPGISIYGLHRDRQGNLWIGTDTTLKFLENRRPAAKTPLPLPRDIMTFGVSIISIYRDRDKNLWVGTVKGVSCLKKNRPVPFPGSEKLSEEYVSAIHQDREGRVWFGTHNGLHCLRDGKLKTFKKKDGLSHNIISCFYEDENRTLWIGTTGGGLNRLKNGKINAVTLREGLFNDSIYRILEDDDGYLWMSCNKGIFRVLRGEVEVCMDGKSTHIHCASYNEADGMKSRECNGEKQPAGCKSSDGKLWFPTIEGVVVIDPRKLGGNPIAPPVKIERFQVDNKDLPIEGITKRDTQELSPVKPGRAATGPGVSRLEIPPGVSRLEIHYAALSYQVPERVSFKTKLEGYDRQWSATIKRRTAYYTKLPPGHFTFRVIACNNDGVWNETGASVSFYIKPAFIQTPWFYLLCGALFFVLLFLGYWFHIRKLKNNERKLRRMIDEHTGALQERNRELMNLEQAIREINREMIMDNVLPALLQKALKLFPQAQAGAFFMYDHTSGQYIAQASQNIALEIVEKMSFQHEIGREIILSLAEEIEKNIYLFPDLSTEPPERQKQIPGNFRSLLVVAAMVADTPRGVFALGTYDAPISIRDWDIHKMILFREHALYALVRAGVLQDLSAMVEERTVELKDKITELTRAKEELKKAGERAERADMVKTRFLTNISHEIRTPMNSILGFSEIMQDEIKDKRYNGFLKAINAGGQTLMALINDILDLSKIEAGKIELLHEHVNPITILEEIKHMFQQECLEKKLSLEIICGEDIPELLELDRIRVRQILFNLVGNAVKFTHEGAVTLSVNRAEEKTATETVDTVDTIDTVSAGDTVDIAFEIRDTGIGIPEDQQEIIFEIFRQQDGLYYEKYGGTGLGLGISRRLTQLMNGTISVESEVNKGSTFTVTLPGIPVSGPVQQPPYLKAESKTEPPEITALILVVDDTEMNRLVLKDTLDTYGFETIEAVNGKEAVDRALQHQPDLILMDIRMPVMNGIEATRLIKKNQATAHIPVVAITAYASDKKEIAGFTDLFADCLFKPVKGKKIMEKVYHYIPAPTPAKNKDNINKKKKIKKKEPVNPVSNEIEPDSTQESAKTLQTPAEKKELLGILRSRITEELKDMQNTFIVDVIKEFAEKNHQLGVRLHAPLLVNWADQLGNEIDNFDIESVTLTLERFPQLIEEIEDGN
ncbi:MAG: response regulator [bacterium]|nr:response regulator [bacterium]